MIMNENGEWESESDREEEGLIFDEDYINNDNEIQPDEGDNNCFISLRVLSVTAAGSEWAATQSFPHSRHDQREVV